MQILIQFLHKTQTKIFCINNLAKILFIYSKPRNTMIPFLKWYLAIKITLLQSPSDFFVLPVQVKKKIVTHKIQDDLSYIPETLINFFH